MSNRGVIILLILFVSGFFSTVSAQQTIYASIMHDEIERDYILYIPDSYSSETPSPLLLNFHGYTSNALEQMNYGDFRTIADAAGFIIAHPLGTVDNVGNTHWNVGWGFSTVDDIGFTSALLDSLLIDYNIDTEKIYSTGMSNGGFMSYSLACNLSGRIAAIASVTGSMSSTQIEECSPEHFIPIMEIHGTADNTVPYNGSFMFEGIENVLNYWIDLNNCNSNAILSEIPDIAPNDGCTATHYLWDNGDNGVVVEHYKIINGGHTWPGSNFTVGVTNQDINASQLIWEFFAKYDINGLINTTAIENYTSDNTDISIYPNPATATIFIDNKFDKPTAYQLYTPLGELVQSGMITDNHYELNLSRTNAKFCFLKIENKVIKISRL